MPFIFAKLLAFLPFGNVLKGTSGKLILFGSLVLLCVFMVWKFKANIKAQVAEVFYQQQVEDMLMETRTEIERLKLIEEARNVAIIKAIQQNESLILSVREGRHDLTTGKYDPTPATQVLKDVLTRIQQIEASKKSVEEEPVEEKTGNRWIDEWKVKVGIGGGSE